MQKQRSKQLIEANLEEDRNIKRLEKQLKLNKRKTKSIPKTFASEGLDCILFFTLYSLGFKDSFKMIFFLMYCLDILEVCDPENIKGIVNAEQELNDSGSEFGEDFALMTNQPLKDASSSEEDKKDIEDRDESSDNFSGDSEDDLSDNNEFETESPEKESSDTSMIDDEELLDEENCHRKKRKNEDEIFLSKKQKTISDHASSSESEIEDENIDDNTSTDKTDTWEDIYGRLRGKDGAVVSVSAICC